MKKFFKYFLATFLGIMISFGMIIAIIAIIIAANTEVEMVSPNSVLQLKLNGVIKEKAQHNPLKKLNPTKMSEEEEIGLDELIGAIKYAKDDPNIRGILLNVDGLNAGYSTAGEIREALGIFKESGKFVISHSDYYSQKAYYLSSVANSIYLNPAGVLEFKGLGGTLMFFKDALAKLGIEPIVIREGKYKSAIEPFVNTEMSEANREQYTALMEDMWLHIKNEVAASRRIEVPYLDSIAEHLLASSAENATKYGLVDSTKYYDEVLAILKDSLNLADNEAIKIVELSTYLNSYRMMKELSNNSESPQVAVIRAQGTIYTGTGNFDIIGGETFAKAVRQAREDENVKAIVLRVNSGGGSALASEVVWREMVLAKQTKPVVVSMGDVAASGGYYIACPANAIIASPTTITGSIGVFGVLWNSEEVMGKIGVSTDVVKTNQYADIGSATRKMKDEERKIIETEIESIYDDFITHVAEGREMQKEMVNELGQGRVWSGQDALENGLIDMLGSCDLAITTAANMANITDYTIRELPEIDDPLELFFRSIGAKIEAAQMENLLGELAPFVKMADEMKDMKGAQARMPYSIIVE